MPRVVIVGGGISGLGLAFRLAAEPAFDVTVLEGSERLGGCVRTVHKDGFTIECGPNGFLDSTSALRDLAHDAGLAEAMIAASESSSRKRFLFLGDRLRPLPSSLPRLLRSRLLGLRGKLALLAEPLRPRRTATGPESVAAFAVRRAGPEAAAIFADALVTGIYGGDSKLLDVRAAFPRLVAYEAASGSVVRGLRRAAKERRAAGRPRPRLWSFRDGLDTLIKALADRLARRPIIGAKVESIRRDGAGWQLNGRNGQTWSADIIVLTCPAPEQAKILGELDPAMSRLLGDIQYNRIAMVALGFPADDVPVDYDGFGFIVPQRLRRDLLGVQWCSAIFPGRAPPGFVLWRALVGGWHRGDVVDWPDNRLIAAVLKEIRQVTGVNAEPSFVHVERWWRAIPQYFLGHPERVATIDELAAQHPGFVLGGNALRGVALNDCAEWAESTAKMLSHR